MQLTVHHLHLSDQLQDCHFVVNAHSNRPAFSWRLHTTWFVKSWSLVASSFGSGVWKALFAKLESGGERFVAIDVYNYLAELGELIQL